jgi:hypothetical protein
MALTYAHSLLEADVIVIYILPKLPCQIIDQYLKRLRQHAHTKVILLTRDEEKIAAHDPKGRCLSLTPSQRILPWQSFEYDALVSTGISIEATTQAIYRQIQHFIK